MIASDEIPAGAQALGASEKEEAGSSAATGSDASELSKDEQDQAGSPKGSTEGGSEESREVRHRGPTKLDTIRELRAKLRERDQRYGSEIETLRGQIEEMKSLIQSGQRGQKPSRTFWEAPEEVTRELTREELRSFKDEMLKEMRMTEAERQQTSEWKQETSEATKLIKNQKGLTPEDEADIAEIVQSTPEMENLRPMQRAKYALYLWKESKGINQDKTELKSKAAGIQGAPPPAGGPRTWSESEMEAELSKFPQDPKSWTPEQVKAFDALDREFRLAYSEKRVRK